MDSEPLLVEMQPRGERRAGPGRLDSCLASPATTALAALQHRDLTAFTEAVADQGFNPEEPAGGEDEAVPRTLLELASDEAAGQDPFIKESCSYIDNPECQMMQFE